jgi:hypothetical protein
MLNIEECIRMEPNLAENQGLSHFLNHAAQQASRAYSVFYDFLAISRPKRILEIGTGMGGFPAFLKICCDDLELDTTVLTYDVVSQYWFDEIRELGVDIKIENIFSEDWTSVNEYVTNYVQGDGLTIVLCDGRFKIKEFRIFSELIKSGDFIMAHDYAENKQIFNDDIYQKVWNWCEITEDDISSSCEANNLKDYKKKDFNSAAWVCKLKQ